MQKYLKNLVVPISILLVFASLTIIWKLLNLPSQEEMIPIVKNYFDRYGIILVFVSAIIESGFVYGVYAPGGIVIFLGVIFSTGNPVQAVLIVTSVILGFLIGYSIDYILGKYGWYKLLVHFGLEKMLSDVKNKVEKYELSSTWLGYHDPNAGSLIATSYGILQHTYKRFITYTIGPVIFWAIFWGTLAYILGEKILKSLGLPGLLIVLGIWIIVRIIETKLENKLGQS